MSIAAEDPVKARRLEVVVVAYGEAGPLQECLETLGSEFSLTVVDNSSLPATRALVESHGGRYLDPGQNLGFGAGVNHALATLDLRDADVLLLNPDAEIDAAGLRTLHAFLQADPGLACAAPTQVNPTDGSDVRVSWPFPDPAGAWFEAFGLHRFRPESGFIIGSVLLIRGEALADVGWFDPRYFLYSEETDWQFRAVKKGWRVGICPDVVAGHVGAGTGGDPTRRATYFHASHERYVRKHYGRGGWYVYRAGTLVDAALRAAVRSGDRRKEQKARLHFFLRGPQRLEAKLGRPVPVDNAGAPGTELKVVHVVCSDGFAGVERHVATLATGLAGRGCETVVIGGNAGRMQAALAGTGVVWKKGDTPQEAGAALLRQRRADIVHAHMTEAEVVTVSIAPLLGAAAVATRHFGRTRGSKPAARAVNGLIAHRLAAEIAISRYVADSVEGQPTIVFPATPEPDPSGGEDRKPVVLVAQRLEKEKRTDVALDIWSESGLAGEGWTLQIVGDGAERAALEAKTDQLGIRSSVQFVGAVSDVESYQRRASIFLAPCPIEALGLAVVEAMAVALPVVAAAAAGYLESVGPVPGATLYPPEDAAAGAELLRRLAHDPEERRTYGEALRAAHREHFSVDSQVEATLAVYREVMT